MARNTTSWDARLAEYLYPTIFRCRHIDSLENISRTGENPLEAMNWDFQSIEQI